MNVDVIIIGQGISGTFLSYYLEKAKRSFLVIDDQKPNAPSRVAAGIINPITGRRLIRTWLADMLLPFAEEVYLSIGDMVGVKAISRKNVIDIFPNPFRREAFLAELKESGKGFILPANDSAFSEQFHYEFGHGEIQGPMIVALDKLLPAWKNHLLSGNNLREETFEAGSLELVDDGVRYGNVEASRIIFCDGAHAASTEFFKFLPFSFNKGEALIIRVPELSREYIYKKTLLLAPIGNGDEFWLGANYKWNYDDDAPTQEFREGTEQQLKNWLKLPYTIVDHKAGIRPATVERRPFVGIHPHHPQIGILNGMGTKGSSLAPYFAKQLCDHLFDNKPIHPEADVKRFARVLARK